MAVYAPKAGGQAAEGGAARPRCRRRLYSPWGALSQMWTHLFNLLGHSWNALMEQTGTTTLGFILWTLGIAAVGWAVSVIRKWRDLKSKRIGSPLTTALVPSRSQGLFVTAVFVLVLLCFFVSVIFTVYAEHQLMVGQIRESKQKLATRTESHCWVQNVTLPAPRTFSAANSLSAAIFFCNTERKAPLFVAVEYDKAPLSVGPISFPAGRHLAVNESLHERQVFVNVTSPSVLPYQIFVITAYGRDATPPIATGIKVTTIDTER